MFDWWKTKVLHLFQLHPFPHLLTSSFSRSLPLARCPDEKFPVCIKLISTKRIHFAVTCSIFTYGICQTSAREKSNKLEWLMCKLKHVSTNTIQSGQFTCSDEEFNKYRFSVVLRVSSIQVLICCMETISSWKRTLTSVPQTNWNE